MPAQPHSKITDQVERCGPDDAGEREPTQRDPRPQQPADHCDRSECHDLDQFPPPDTHAVNDIGQDKIARAQKHKWKPDGIALPQVCAAEQKSSVHWGKVRNMWNEARQDRQQNDQVDRSSISFLCRSESQNRKRAPVRYAILKAGKQRKGDA